MADIFTFPTNMTEVVDILPLASDITGGFLGILILILLGAVTFMVTSTFSPKQGFVATGFVVTIASFFLWLLELISTDILWIMVAFFVVLIVMSFFIKDTPA